MERLVTMITALLCMHYSHAQTVTQLYKDIEFLSSDSLQGRLSGSPSERIAADYIASRFEQLGLRPAGEEGYFQFFDYKVSNNPHTTAEQDADATPVHARNVIGYMDNGKEYTIVIGAHYDHLGLGEFGSSLEANSKGMIHNGADDNASGVAGLFYIASKLNKSTLNYNVLFIAFSGEEQGLRGSKYFVHNPSIPLTSISYMFNMDMIGRLKSSRVLLVSGVGTSPSWGTAISHLQTDLSIREDSAGLGPSDHSSFYLEDIPVLHFFTGQHRQYHKPSDDIDSINIEGEKDVLDYMLTLIYHANTGEKLEFTKTKNPDMGTKTSFKVTLGIMPDYTYEKEGLRIDGVTEGRAADKCGIVQGDIILSIGDQEIKNIQDYMKVLGVADKGVAYPSKIMRGTKTIDLDIIF